MPLRIDNRGDGPRQENPAHDRAATVRERLHRPSLPYGRGSDDSAPKGKSRVSPLPRRPRSGSNNEGRRGSPPPNRRAVGPCMSVLLSVQGLTKGYGPRPLFSDLSLDLRAGERVGLIGPNGSGKSTLLRLLAGREESDAGVRSLRRTARLGYVAQDDAFPPGQSVRDVLLRRLRNPARRYRRDAGGTRARNPRRCHPDPGRLHRPRPAGRTFCPAAGASGWRWPASWSAGPTCCCWTSRPTTSICRASSGWSGCCGRPLRLRRRHSRPGLPAGGRRRDRRDQPRLPRRLFPRRRILRPVRRAARGVPGGAGAPTRSGRQSGPPRNRMAVAQGVGPAQQVGFPH